MATNDFDKCHFSFVGQCTCSPDVYAIKTFNQEEQAVCLTSCGILPVLGSVNIYRTICSNHLTECRTAHKKRLMNRLCQAPPVLSFHTGSSCRTERHISEKQVATIFKNTGIVLPIGTGKY